MLIENISYAFPTSWVNTAGGLRLAYTEVGQGLPLLFLHGLGSNLTAWSKNLPFLSRHYRCLALDLPGYGKSSKEGFSPGMGFYADVVAEFLDSLALNECFLTGHSMGGQVAIHTALRYPRRVKKLALLAPAGLETFSTSEARQLEEWFSVEKLIKAPRAVVAQNVKANFHHFLDDAQALLEDRLYYTHCSDYPRFCQTLSGCVTAMLNEPVSTLLPELQMPVLLLFGLQDRYIPSPLLHPQLSLESLVQAASTLIPQAQPELINNCGHFIQWEQAGRVNKLLHKFYQEQAH
ncbi:alpha/beta hydrolase [Flammeovirgaceae bacterium 311]|nr:alpha/beta hydrolase [Flammeovirgaceae bacterium 311]